MDISLETDDGARLSAQLFSPANAIGAALIVPAMGVPQRFYEPLARWLREQDFVVMTFDFRGMGKSKNAPLGAVLADIVTWARQDAAAALRTLSEHAHGVPITWIGHSLGGQIVPFVPNRRLATKIVTIATGSGYWRENSPALRRKVWLLWWALAPIATPLFGYFPGRRLGMVGDLPRGVIEQWRKWCLNPEYAVGAEGAEVRSLFASVDTPLTAFSFTDDEMMSAENVTSIHGFYTGAPKSMRRLTPSELGVRMVGHFGFFRPEMEYPLWRAHLYPELAQSASSLLASA
jgi:predicted alpha/beta hydrolase